MIKAKVGGIVLGGFAGYLILSKGLGAIERCVKNVCVAREWKNYYKYNKDGNMVPPGYSRTVTNAGNEDASKSPSSGSVGEAIARAVVDAFKGSEGENGASEGQIEASEKDICPRDCDECTITEKCPYKHLRYDGKITEWDENGKPVAGRYSWTEGEDTELCWRVETKERKPTVIDTVEKARQFKDYVQSCREKQMGEKEIALSLGEEVSSLRRMIYEAENILSVKTEDEWILLDEILKEEPNKEDVAKDDEEE